MVDGLKQVEERTQRRERTRKRRELMEIIRAILNGEIDSSEHPVQRYFSNRIAPRADYISPRDRSQYNYGYMEIDEMLAGTQQEK